MINLIKKHLQTLLFSYFEKISNYEKNIDLIIKLQRYLKKKINLKKNYDTRYRNY